MEEIELINIIEIPHFIPKYENNIVYGYDKRGKQRENLKELLLRTSNSYCMYCYRSVYVDKIDFSQIEHAIEKGKENSKLRNCVPNLGLSCPLCNMSLKRRHEKTRLEFVKKRKEYDILQKHNCKPSHCKKACDDYLNLVNAYHECEYGALILNPGVTVFRDSKKEAVLQYDIFRGEFQPSYKVAYSAEEYRFIENHIAQFDLNDPDRRSDAFYNYSNDVVDGKINCRIKGHYNNYIVDLFIDKVKNLTDEQVINICKTANNMAKKVGRIVEF